MTEYIRGELAPPANEFAGALRLVGTGQFAGHPDPDNLLMDMPAAQRAAILYGVDRGCVGEDDLVLTDKGRRVLAILGG